MFSLGFPAGVAALKACPRRMRLSFSPAFTLMEVLVVIALLGLVSSLVVTDFSSMVHAGESPSAREALTECLKKGRERAVRTGGLVSLTYDPVFHALRLSQGSGFERILLPEGAVAEFKLAEENPGEPEHRIESVVFHPSGFTTPALVELTVSADRSVYLIDPFSSALMEVLP